MATLDHGSPSQFVGQPWSSWADKVVSHENKDAASSGQADDVDGALEVPDGEPDRDQDKEQVMKLRIEDANVFGICPTQDEFYLVVCEQCGQVIKPQALERHMELRHGKPPDKPPDIPCRMEIMHSPPIRIPTTLRATRSQQQPSRIPLNVFEESPIANSEPSLPPRAASQPQQQEMTFDTVLSKQLPGHLVQRQGSPLNYTTSRGRDSVSPVVPGKPSSPLDIQDAISNLVSPNVPIVRLERMSPQQAHEASMQPLGISSVSLARTIELAPVQTGPIQCASNLIQQQQTQTLIHHQGGKPIQTAMVQLAPVPAALMQTVKPALVQPPPIQPAPVPTSLLKLAPAQPVQTKRNKKLSPKKNILCKDREFDVNRHCGVWVDADQRQCTRSLTCKTHALSLRRAVKGRRKTFDELLAEHKARSQALALANNPSLLKKSVPPPSSTSGPTNNLTTSQGNARPSTPKVVTPRPNTPKAMTPKVTTPKVLSPRPQTMGSLHIKSESNAKPHVMFQKIMPVPGPAKSFNLNSVLPVKKSHPPFTLQDSFPTPDALTPQSKAAQVEGVGSSSSWAHGKPGEGDKTMGEVKSDYSCSHHHPRPVAMCSYGARQVGKGLYTFNRRLDHLRSTMAALVEKHSRPPPLKKMCLSRDSSQELSAPMDTSPPSHAPDLQLNNSASHSAASSSAFSSSSASLFDNVPSGSKTLSTLCSNSSSGVNILNRTKGTPNAVCNNLNKGLASSKKLGKTSGKSGDGKSSSSSSQQHPVKNSKARRKSGGGGGKSHTSMSGSVTQNLFSVSSANPVTLTTGSSSYSIVTNSGLQQGDMLSSGMINIDPASIANQELSGSLLKNLRFVVTNIEPNVNGGAAGNAAAPQTTGNFTVPILNATLGNTPVLLGNLGALALPYDGKLNVKSRTKSASSGKSAADRHGRRLSGSNTTANLQNVAIVSQHFVENTSHDALGTGGVTGGDRRAALNTYQPLQSPQSVPSPQLRPNSASPQLTSPLPNGIIPSPTNITFKPYPGTSIAPSTTVSANHVQRGMSPSRTSTPSPGSCSVDASPIVSGQLLTGSFNTSGKLSLVSPKGSSHNLQKSTLNQKHGHHQHHPHRTVSQLSTQQQHQQQQQQQQALQFHQLQLTPQQIQQQLQQQISNLVAMDTQGKPLPLPLPLSSALIPSLFQTIPAQQMGTGVLPGGLTLTPAVATEQGGKVLSQSAILPQGAITLLQQPGSGQPIRLQGPGLSDQSQLSMSQDEDNRQELKMQH